MSDRLDHEQPMRTWSHAQLIFHIDKLEMDYATGQNIIEEVQQQLKQVTQERDEGRKVIEFYGDKSSWIDNNFYQTTIDRGDWSSAGPINAIGGKRAREHQKKWDKITLKGTNN